VLFWSMGYAILWSDGTSLSPTPAHESLLGQGVKGIESTIARRSLIKPQKVKEKTPAKPEPRVSKVQIERQQSYSVARKRPVSVSTEGKPHAGSERRFKSQPIPRPQRPEEKKLLLPSGAKKTQTGTIQKAPATTQSGRSRVGPRDSGNSRAKSA
jgi:hypothetical protein